MAGLSGNQCTIITIIPMEVECNITNASTPTSSDGIAQVQVFGGTPPYLITWTNGIISQQGDTLSNLLPGTYSATVVDYFGDYVVTTECVVGSASQVVYQFDSCPGFAAQTIYVSGSTYAPPFPYFKPTTIFNEIAGCWNFIGPISSLGLTYSALTVSNTYSNCSNCNPPTPTPLPQDTLCLTGLNSNPSLSQQYEFTPNGTDGNGNYQWIDSANGLTMSYNVVNLMWEVLTWAGTNGNMQLSQSPVQLQPVGQWTNNGGDPKFTWNVATGPCTGIPLSLNTSPTHPYCSIPTPEVGSVIMTAFNGVTPYQYSILGTQGPQSSGQFTNVSPGTYVGSVTDSNTPPNTATSNFVINNGPVSTQYSLLLTKFNEVITNTLNKQVVTYDYTVEFTSSSGPIPSGVSVGFDLNFAHTEQTETEHNSSDVLYGDSIIGDINGNPLTFVQSNPFTLSSPLSPGCEFIPTATASVTTYNTTTNTSLTMVGGSVLNGKVTTSTEIVGPVGSSQCDCLTSGTNKISGQLSNIVLLPVGTICGFINPQSSSIMGESTQSACVLT